MRLYPNVTDPNVAIGRGKKGKSFQKDFFKRYFYRGVIAIHDQTKVRIAL